MTRLQTLENRSARIQNKKAILFVFIIIVLTVIVRTLTAQPYL
jgi:hypothetical protein